MTIKRCLDHQEPEMEKIEIENDEIGEETEEVLSVSREYFKKLIPTFGPLLGPRRLKGTRKMHMAQFPIITLYIEKV